jgi:uncharacterized protein
MRTLLILAILAPSLCAQGTEYVRGHYTKFEFRIPMRDGKRLYTAVYSPKDHSQKYPFLIERTPYSCGPYGIENYPGSIGYSEKFVREGYIFVCQDVRGRYESEGTFVEMTPHLDVKKGNTDVDQSSDTYDTIEWLLKNMPDNNGRAGIIGISYPGFYAAAGMVDAHPALKAASPQAPMVNLFLGDDNSHNGAFYLAANFDFHQFFNEHKSPQQPSHERNVSFYGPSQDSYEFLLSLGPLSNAQEKYFKFQNPYWTDLMKHTSYDEFWQARNLEPHFRSIRPAVLVVGGWFDAEDLQGPLRLYRATLANQPKGPVTLVEGPWPHGGWAGGDGAALGPVQFDSKTSEYFRENIQFPFFEYFLKDKGTWKAPAAWVFETGTNQWRTFDSWPPKQAERKTIFLHKDGKLSFEPPEEAEGFDAYISDPAKPVPYTSFISRGMSRTYMVDDQRMASTRPDVLNFESQPLEQDITLSGPIGVKLFAATSGTDSDWVVKLIDVYPGDFPDPSPNPANLKMGGYEQLVRGEPFRGRFWKSWEHPGPLPPNEFVKIEYVMPDVLHTFQRGHRIMVQIQSSWFPLIDRNPQKFVPNIPDARAEDFIKTTQRIAHTKSMPSTLDVMVLH